MEIAYTDFELIILPGRNPSKVFETFYEAAYETWHKTWTEAAQELEDFPETLYANDFLSQNEVFGLFYRGECTSLGLLTPLDMNLRASREDAYFKNWNDDAIEKLTKDGSVIIKNSYFTVERKYRRWAREHGFKFPDVHVGLFNKRLEESNFSAMTSTSRNNRKINEVCINGGAKVISKDLEQHGVKIDLLSWYKNDIKFNPDVYELVEDIWNRRKIDPKVFQYPDQVISEPKQPDLNI